MTDFSDFKYHIFIDESGCLGFADNSSKYFVVTALCTKNPKSLKKRIWRQKATLHNQGWPKNIEIKGFNVWSPWNHHSIPQKFQEAKEARIITLLDDVLKCPQQIFYCVVKKAKIAQHLKSAPYGILYNYYVGKLLARTCQQFFNGPTRIVVDQRSKETHTKTKFNGYVETAIYVEAGFTHPTEILHLDSNSMPGLQVVDFYSWSIFRHYEYGDNQFFDKLTPHIAFQDRWFT